MEKVKIKSRYLYMATIGSLLLLGAGIFCFYMVKTTLVENEQKNLLRLAQVSAQSLEASFQVKESLIYGAFSGDMGGEEEIRQNMLKVGGRGKYILLSDIPKLQQWEQESCKVAGAHPGKVITSPARELSAQKYVMYMTKAVYIGGSIAGYVQMEIDLQEIYEDGALSEMSQSGNRYIVKSSSEETIMPQNVSDSEIKLKVYESAEGKCYQEWIYETVQGVPKKVRKLIAVSTITVGGEQLTLYVIKNYKEIVQPIEQLSLALCLIGALLLTWIAGFLYKITRQQKEEEKLMQELQYEKELNKALYHQERLMQKYNHSKTLGILTGSIAHEFNNLMTPIVLYANLLEEEEVVKAVMPEEVEELRSSAERCGELADQLLQYTRLGRTEKVLVDYNATVAVRESVRIVKRLLPEHVVFIAEICEKSHYIRGQIGTLNQIILNLTSNSIYAMAEKGELKVQFGVSAESEKMVRLIITDTGKGIPTEIRQRIFEPFFTTKEDKGGTGIGLTVVKRLVEEHSGFIRVESEAGAGTTFVIDIPETVEKKDC